MVRSAASLIASRGVSGTSLSDVLAESGAPRGSLYHHFPEGKRQLAEDAIRWTSERVLAHQRAAPGASPQEVLESFIDLWRRTVAHSNAGSGCVVAGVAVDTGADDPEMLELVRSTFRSWTTLLTQRLDAAGVTEGRAMPIALATLAAMEGALILCRAEGTGAPLEAVAVELMRLLPRSGER